MTVTREMVEKLEKKYLKVKALKSDNQKAHDELQHQVGNKLVPFHSYVSGDSSAKELKFDPDITYKNCMKTLNNIIDGAKISEFDLVSVVAEVLDDFKKNYALRHQPVEILFDKSEKYIALGNEIHVYDALENICNNTVRHGKFDEKNIFSTVEVNIEPYEDGLYAVTISDQGKTPAMNLGATPEESRNLVFSPKVTSHEEGQGDAMYLFRDHLRNFGGDILVDYMFPTNKERTQGFGTKFTTLIPYAKKD